MVAVIPVAPALRKVRSDSVPLCYGLVPAEVLPRVDVKRTLRQVVLGETWSRRHAAFMKRHATLSVTCYFLGLVYRFYGMVVSTQYSLGRWLMVASILQAPSASAVTLSLRVDIIRQLATSFEFWFFSAVNVVWAVALVAAYSDARVSVCFMNWLETENAKVTDANLQGLHFVVATATMAIVMLVTFIVSIAFNLLVLKPVVLFVTPRGHIMLVQDVLLNVMSTILVFMVRLAYRRRHAVRHTTATRATLCVTCRCRLKFECCDPNPHTSRAAAATTKRDTISTSTNSDGKIQLECVPIHEKFFAGDTLSHVGISSLSRCLRWAWLVAMVAALVSSMLLCVVSPPPSVLSRDAFAAATLAVTIVAATPFLLLHQRQLLRRLYGSFDFVFVLVQLSSVTLCVCHLTQWAPHTCVVAACVWIWFYVVITTDALTPDAKQRLHWRPRHAAWLALGLLVATLLLVLDLTVWGAWNISDRVLLDWNVFGTRVQISGTPFLFSRLAIVVVWNCRLLWRLANCGDDELIMLVGAVQDEIGRQSRSAVAASSPASPATPK